MIGRLYSVGIGSQAQTTAKTLMEVTAASDVVVLWERIHLAQTSFDTSENLGVKLEDVTTTGTGTNTGPVPHSEGDAAFGATNIKTNFTIEPTYSGTVFIESGFNVLSGYLWTPASDDEVYVIAPSQIHGFRLDVAPSGSMDFSYGCTLREIGG